MKDWFLGLESRERLFVSVGGVLAAIFLLWALLLSPLYGASAAVESRIENKRDTLLFLRNAAAELQAAGERPAGTGADFSGQSLVSIVDRSARRAGLGAALTRNQPVGDDGIRVRLDDASFDALARWLGALNAGSGLVIDSASFDRAAQSGHVNASLVFRKDIP